MRGRHPVLMCRSDAPRDTVSWRRGSMPRIADGREQMACHSDHPIRTVAACGA
jgi:hypothetical protein